MKSWEVKVERPWDDSAIAEAIEKVARDHGLKISLRGMLRKYPGCVHWHFKKPRSLGTMEVTMWPQERRVWISVHRLRSAGWIDEQVGYIRKDLGRWLSRLAEVIDNH